MNFEPTEARRTWEGRAARLAREVLAPRAAGLDARGAFPHENFAQLRCQGFLCLAVPAWYGGLRDDHVAYARAMLALGGGCAGTTCCLAMHFGCVLQILAAGSREQKERLMAWVDEKEALLAIAGTDTILDAQSPPRIVVAHRADGRPPGRPKVLCLRRGRLRSP